MILATIDKINREANAAVARAVFPRTRISKYTLHVERLGFTLLVERGGFRAPNKVLGANELIQAYAPEAERPRLLAAVNKIHKKRDRRVLDAWRANLKRFEPALLRIVLRK